MDTKYTAEATAWGTATLFGRKKLPDKAVASFYLPCTIVGTLPATAPNVEIVSSMPVRSEGRG